MAQGVERIGQLTQLFTVSASLPLKRHWQRGGRSSTETVTIVTRFRITTMSQSGANDPNAPALRLFAATLPSVPALVLYHACPAAGAQTFCEDVVTPRDAVLSVGADTQTSSVSTGAGCRRARAVRAATTRKDALIARKSFLMLCTSVLTLNIICPNSHLGHFAGSDPRPRFLRVVKREIQPPLPMPALTTLDNVVLCLGSLRR